MHCVELQNNKTVRWTTRRKNEDKFESFFVGDTNNTLGLRLLLLSNRRRTRAKLIES